MELVDEDTLTGSAPRANRTVNDRFYLIVLSGHSMGDVIRLEKSATLGRANEADIRLLDSGISRLHAQLFVDGSAVWVRDLGSRNGTFVNGERVTELRLTDGDEVEVGVATTIRINAFDSAEEAFVRQLCESALLDPVTKTFNRRYFVDRMQREISYSSRHEAPLSLLVVDVEPGDEQASPDAALCHVRHALAAAVRHEDVVTRLDDKSFAIICRDVDGAALRQLAARIRDRIAASSYIVGGRGYVPVVAVSGGLRPRDVNDVNAFLALIEAARETAKKQRRVIIVGDERRIHSRLDLAATIVMRPVGSLEWLPARTCDLAIKGMGFEAATSPELAVGSEIDLAAVPVEEGEVVRCTVRNVLALSQEGQQRVGVEFAASLKAHTVEAWVKRLEEPKLRLLLPTTDTVPVPQLPTPPKLRPRLLVVDDEPALLNTIRRSLRMHYDIVGTTRAVEALGWIESGERYDLVLSDIQMPELDGIQFYATLTERAPEQAERMVFMTGGIGLRDVDDFLGQLQRPMLTKPFRLEELVATLTGFLKSLKPDAAQ